VERAVLGAGDCRAVGVAGLDESVEALAQARASIAVAVAIAVIGASKFAAVNAGEAGVARAVSGAASGALAVNALPLERAVVHAASGSRLTQHLLAEGLGGHLERVHRL